MSCKKKHHNCYKSFEARFNLKANVQLSHVSNSKRPAPPYQTHFDRPSETTLKISEICTSGSARRAGICGSNTSAWSNILRTVVASSRKWSNLWYYLMQTWTQVHAATSHQVHADWEQPPAMIVQRGLRDPNQSLWAHKQLFIQLTRQLQWLKQAARCKWTGFAPQFLLSHISSASGIWFCSLSLAWKLILTQRNTVGNKPA